LLHPFPTYLRFHNDPPFYFPLSLLTSLRPLHNTSLPTSLRPFHNTSLPTFPHRQSTKF
jgi:hypothetical protein